jgi:hypothetical protein
LRHRPPVWKIRPITSSGTQLHPILISSQMLREKQVKDHQTEKHRDWEDRLARPMFVLAMLFLMLLAGVIHRANHFAEAGWGTPDAWILFGGLALLWPLFVVEAILRVFLLDRRTWKPVAICLAPAVFPPLRMGARSVTRADTMWLPWMGWGKVDFDLQKTLERVFTGPMLVMALMILPVLAIEYFWAAAVERHPPLRVALAFSVAVIWIAFTTELIIRISAAEGKIAYAFNHWVDLAVVLLPTVEFMPFLRVLRVTRVMRLDSLARLAKYYRLYGLAGKGWRGMMVLQVIHRLFNRSPEARLSRLRSHLEDKQDEMRDIEREMDYYRRRIETVERELAQSHPERAPTEEAAETEKPPADSTQRR